MFTIKRTYSPIEDAIYYAITDIYTGKVVDMSWHKDRALELKDMYNELPEKERWFVLDNPGLFERKDG